MSSKEEARDIAVIGFDHRGWTKLMNTEDGWKDIFVDFVWTILEALDKSQSKMAVICIVGENGRNEKAQEIISQCDKSIVKDLLDGLNDTK